MMRKILLLSTILICLYIPVCLAFQVDETKWQKVEAEQELFIEKASVTYESDGVCHLTALMATKGDNKYLISDYVIYRDSRTIVTLKHDIYDYDTDRKIHTVQYPSYSPKHVAIELHGAGEELYEAVFGEKKNT